MSISRRMAWASLIIIAVLAIGTLQAMAAEPAVKIAVVDIEKINNNAPRVKQYVEEVLALKQSLGSKLEIRSRNLMLDDNEIKELIELKLKPNPTEQDKARIKQLEDLEKSRDAELTELSNLKELNDQQKARLKELQNMQQRSKTIGADLTKDYEGQLQVKYKEMMDKAEADVREAISKVAKDKAFTLVVAKDAVLYGGTDITDEVIAKLDRKMQ